MKFEPSETLVKGLSDIFGPLVRNQTASGTSMVPWCLLRCLDVAKYHFPMHEACSSLWIVSSEIGRVSKVER